MPSTSAASGAAMPTSSLRSLTSVTVCSWPQHASAGRSRACRAGHRDARRPARPDRGVAAAAESDARRHPRRGRGPEDDGGRRSGRRQRGERRAVSSRRFGRGAGRGRVVAADQERGRRQRHLGAGSLPADDGRVRRCRYGDQRTVLAASSSTRPRRGVASGTPGGAATSSTVPPRSGRPAWRSVSATALRGGPTPTGGRSLPDPTGSRGRSVSRSVSARLRSSSSLVDATVIGCSPARTTVRGTLRPGATCACAVGSHRSIRSTTEG